MYNNLVEIPWEISKKYPERISHRFRKSGKFVDKTYLQFVNDIKLLSLGFFSVGISENDHISFFVNNRYEWSVTDFALQSLSAISVPRGSDTSPKEAEFIYNHSDSKYVIFENISQLQESIEIVEKAAKVFVVDNGSAPEKYLDKIHFYSELMELGEKISLSDNNKYLTLINLIEPTNIVSIIYTSGTTGNPKGVVLTQQNFTANVEMTAPRMGINEAIGEVTVTVLPAWHAFERTFEYSGLSKGISFVYSSLKNFSEDILKEKPHLLASVPRIWDSIYTKMNVFMKSQKKTKRNIFFFLVNMNFSYKRSLSYLKKSYVTFKKDNFLKLLLKTTLSVLNIIFLFLLHLFAEKTFAGVRNKVGGRLRCAISGGGSLPVAIDKFYSSVGINVLNAYGMTECSPGIASRNIHKNTLGSVGTPFINTEIKILDDDNNIVTNGEKGTLYVKGPQVMQGYYKNKTATEEILTNDGWLNTGDLARITTFGEIVLVGRSKDTIVLLGGENVDPLAIEDKIQESEMIDHAMLLGQDKKGLTAFIALNEESLNNFANEVKVKISDIFSFLHNDKEEPSTEYKILEKKIKDELDKKISKESGFKPFEKITNVILVKNTFKIGHELTQTLKIKRKQIEEIYHSIISRFMNDNDKKA